MAVEYVTEEASDWSRDDWGLLGEQAVCERYQAEHVATDDTTPDWIDAIVEADVVEDGFVLAEAGDPIQAKVTVFRSREYRSARNTFTRRRGRYFVRRHAHEALLDADGLYAFGVYDPALKERNPIALTLVDAADVEDLGLTWCSNGGGLEAARLNWSEVFDTEHVAARRDDLLAQEVDT